MDEDMISLDPIEFQSEEELYKDRIDFYQRKTGLTEAIQTGTVGEKITHLFKYATNNFLPLILVCAFEGARIFGMLRDIIIAEPNAYIAFVSKRVIEQTLNKKYRKVHRRLNIYSIRVYSIQSYHIIL
ncbi:hypothetical protein Gotur_006211 [Gossypium turneri]